MQSVDKGNRPHVVLVGAVNSGKSTLFNRLIGQELAVVSSLPGTTTDAVSKAIELPGVGPVVIVDTPGLNDHTEIGDLRMEHTRRVLREADMVLLLLTPPDLSCYDQLKGLISVPLIPLIAKDPISDDLSDSVAQKMGMRPMVVGEDLTPLIERIRLTIAEQSPHTPESITGGLAQPGDLVLLVMPQDASAPKGRLILPQVQTIRELLDKHCLVLSVQPSELSSALSHLISPPRLIITDSQAFAEVERLCPEGVPLTSFSVLMSALKGDLPRLVAGAGAIERLTPTSRVLIAEACTHAPETEDIGTVKIPRLLRKRFGDELRIDHVSGRDFPTDLTSYDLVIHCGACMFNRRHLLSRQTEAEVQSVPMTNYGLAIAQLLGILSKVALP